jgi:hypothetical protein
MELEKKLMPMALDLYADIGKVLFWAQSMPSSGIRTGTYQACISLLTNGVRLMGILEGKETIEDFVKDCLEKDCPDLSLEIISKNTKRFLYGNYANIETIQDWLEEFNIDPEDFDEESNHLDPEAEKNNEFSIKLNQVECEYFNGKPKFVGMKAVEEALKRCSLISTKEKRRYRKVYQNLYSYSN